MLTMEQAVALLQDRDDNQAYQALLFLEEQTLISNAVYVYFDDFLQLLQNEHTYVKMRAIRLVAKNARWDIEHKLENNIESYISLLQDSKPAVVREVIRNMKEIVPYKPQLLPILEEAFLTIPLQNYKESMASLIVRDQEDFEKWIEKRTKEDLI